MTPNLFRVHCVLSYGMLVFEGGIGSSLVGLVCLLCMHQRLYVERCLFFFLLHVWKHINHSTGKAWSICPWGKEREFTGNTLGICYLYHPNSETKKKTMLIYKKWVSGFPLMPLCHNNVASPHDLCSGGWWLIFFSTWWLSGIQDQALKCAWNWTRPLYASGFSIRGASSRNTHGKPHNVG